MWRRRGLCLQMFRIGLTGCGCKAIMTGIVLPPGYLMGNLWTCTRGLLGLTVDTLWTWTGIVGIIGMIIGTFIVFLSGTGIVCSGVGVGSGFGMTGGAQGISCFRSFAMDSIANYLLVLFICTIGLSPCDGWLGVVSGMSHRPSDLLVLPVRIVFYYYPRLEGIFC